LAFLSGGRVFDPQDLERPLTGGHGVIRGRVTLPSGTPISAATVQLASLNETRPSRSATTDDEGRFAFDALPPGEFMLGAAKTAYVTSVVDRDPLSGVQVRLADSEVRTNVDLVLARPAIITGRILDEFGEPYEGAMVSVWQTRYENGRRHLVGVKTSVNATDDRGRYRVINVPPGRYFVAASAGTGTPAQPIGDVPGYALTYFPAAVAVANAQPIDITRSTSETDLDIALVRTPTARVTGRVVGPNGTSLALMVASLAVSYRSKAILGPSFSAMRQENGRFEFTNVPPGDYVIQAGFLRTNRSTEGDFAAQFVTVTGTDVTEVVLNATAGSTIAGRVTFDGRDAPTVPDFGIVAESADFDLAPREARYIARAEMRPDLSFEVRGVHGPRRIVITGSPGGWVLKSVSAKGVEVTDRALPFGLPQQSLKDVEIVLTNRLTELIGTVTDSRGDATRNYALLAFPVDRERWYPGSRYFRRAIPNVDGSFTVRGLPPGDYQIAAVSVGSMPVDGETAWQDPGFLESIASRAAFAALTEGQKLSVNARLITP
ncbi:MAG TPA: carboxypeptidase regulatory-like domain-containing protein, partial [Vicinamibacterales bacterium]|nr:carboxypeptidase regulatory-like domain-containing protein [Vicinamibacterales bacterium]